jgi:hypothetical protein
MIMLKKQKLEEQMKRHYLIILSIFTMIAAFINLEIFAQDNGKQLIITEAYLDLKNKEVWIEVYNPSDGTLILSSMRISGIKTPSVLPKEFNGKGDIKLKPGERIIICSYIKSFHDKYGKNIRAAELKLLSSMLNGGFVAINHMTGIENKQNAVRFGPKEKSAVIANIVDDTEVLNFTDDGMSYAREILKDGKLSTWKKTNPKPGQMKERR